MRTAAITAGRAVDRHSQFAAVAWAPHIGDCRGVGLLDGRECELIGEHLGLRCLEGLFRVLLDKVKGLFGCPVWPE